MRMLGGFLIAVVGAVIGVGGLGLFQMANSAISRGESFWGLGWYF